MSPSHVQKPLCIPHLFLFVENNSTLLYLPWVSNSRLKWLLLREMMICRNKGKAIKKDNLNNSSVIGQSSSRNIHSPQMHTFGLLCRNQDPWPGIGWWLYTDLSLVGTWKLMIEVPEMPPCHLTTTTQSKEIHAPCNPHSKYCILKPFPENHRGVWAFWAWATSSPCLVHCKQTLYFPSLQLVSIDCLCWVAGRWTQV